MAVILLQAIHTYVGASTDTKPTSVPVGSTFLEYNTDAKFVTYDGTNWVQVDDQVALVAGSAVIGKVRLVDSGGTEVTEATGHTVKVSGATTDNGPAWTSAYLYTASADATGKVAVTAAPTGTQKIVIDDIIVSTDTAMNIIFEDETAATPLIKLFLPANGSAQITPRGRIKLPVADKKLMIDASVAGNVAVTCVYHSEA